LEQYEEQTANARNLALLTAKAAENVFISEAANAKTLAALDSLTKEVGRLIRMIDGNGKPGFPERFTTLEMLEREHARDIEKLESLATKMLWSLLGVMLTVIGTLVTTFVLHGAK